ncbi:MAG: glycosyltransferase, partial [Terriglobales bacterium]
LGVDSKTITVSGIPIDPIFAYPKEKSAMRKKYGLDPERTTIIVSAGGFGVGPMEQLLAALAQMKHDCQVIAMCGKNEQLKTRLQSVASSSSEADRRHLLLHPVAFTKDMDEYMAASDLVLGKPGGLTTAEALSKGLVYVIVNPIPGQEERNSDHLLEEGAAIRCNNLPTLAYKLDGLLDDPQRLRSMQANALRLSHPMAAQEVAAKLLQLQAARHLGTITGTGHACYSHPLGKTLEFARRSMEKPRLTFMRTIAKQRRLNLRAVVPGLRSKSEGQ